MPNSQFSFRNEPIFIGGAFGAAALFPEFIGAALDVMVNQLRSLGVVFKMH